MQTQLLFAFPAALAAQPLLPIYTYSNVMEIDELTAAWMCVNGLERLTECTSQRSLRLHVLLHYFPAWIRQNILAMVKFMTA